MVKVSVIVPVYNMEAYIEKCLRSLCLQEMKDAEFLIINDGSTDCSEKIINKFVKKDSRVKLYNKKNGGISSARNYGIKKANGEYICFVDCDDYVSNDYLIKLYNCAKENSSDIVICNYYRVDEKSGNTRIENIVNFDTCNLEENKELIFKINCSPWNKIYKRELFENIEFPPYKYEDMAVIPILLHKANKISKINENLYYYLIRKNGETGIVNNKTQDIMKILDILYEYFHKCENFKEEIDFFAISKIHIYMVKQRFQNNITDALNNCNELKKYLKSKNINIRNNKYYSKNINIKQKIVYYNYRIIFRLLFFMKNRGARKYEVKKK